MTTEINGHATPASVYQQEHPSLADNGFHYLQHHAWTDVNSDHDFEASLAVGKFILQAGAHDPSIMTSIVDQTVDVIKLLFTDIPVLIAIHREAQHRVWA